MTEYTVTDLVGAALEKNPETFQAAFNDVMGAKVAAAIEIRKQEVAQNFMSDEQETVTDEEDTTEVTNEE